MGRDCLWNSEEQHREWNWKYIPCFAPRCPRGGQHQITTNWISPQFHKMLSFSPIQKVLQVISMLFSWYNHYYHVNYMLSFMIFVFCECRARNSADNQKKKKSGSAELMKPAFCKSESGVFRNTVPAFLKLFNSSPMLAQLIQRHHGCLIWRYPLTKQFPLNRPPGKFNLVVTMSVCGSVPSGVIVNNAKTVTPITPIYKGPHSNWSITKRFPREK